jgi:hypothetical protein
MLHELNSGAPRHQGEPSSERHVLPGQLPFGNRSLHHLMIRASA